MKCPRCNGRKYIELDKIGLRITTCPECKGTGEVADIVDMEHTFSTASPVNLDSKIDVLGGVVEKYEVDVSGDDVSYTGLLFQLAGPNPNEFSDGTLWMMIKEATIEKMIFPHTVEMPCGHKETFESPASIWALPIKDLPCPCGNPNHYIVRFIDLREVVNDDISRTERDNSDTGSGDTGKPKVTRKPKARKKARAKTS